jgi:quercetin dioxygenase-like cupin family protein
VSTTYVEPGAGGSFWVGTTELVTLKTTGDDTGGAFALVELVAMPGSEPPPHIRRRTDELYCLLEGALEVLDGERTFTARAGSVFHIRKGTLRAWRNATSRPARALLFITPAGSEGVIEEVGVPAAGLIAELGPPRRGLTQAQVAALAGVAPLEASTAGGVRHRLNRGGDRRLNRLLHVNALI